MTSKNGHHQFNRYNYSGNYIYLECRLEDTVGREYENRLIGLIVIKMLPHDEEDLQFKLRDSKENKVSHNTRIYVADSKAIRINL